MGRVSYTITRTPAYAIDAEMEPGSEWNTDIPPGWNALVYVLEGVIEIGGDKVRRHEVATLTQWDTDLQVECKGKVKCRVFLAAAEPLNEMIVAFGQFYMPNYPMAEKANRDFKTGKDGFEGSVEWRSKHKKA